MLPKTVDTSGGIIGGQDIGSRPLLMMTMLLIIVGIQMLSIGLVAEMLMRTYYEAQGIRPYQVAKKINFA